MRVVVLMSTYNGERYLREQIESILNQIGEFDLSLYVRDDGSKDGTIEILREYQNEKKLKWYTGDNLGPAKLFISVEGRLTGKMNTTGLRGTGGVWI